MQKVTVFDFENDNMFEYDFTQNIPVLIYNGEFWSFYKKIFGYSWIQEWVIKKYVYVDYNVKLIYTTNTDFSKRYRYEDEVMV